MSMSLEFGRNGMEGLREETDEKIYGASRTQTPYETEEEIKKRQRVLIEGLTPSEDADHEEIIRAMEEVRKAARADYSHRLSDEEATARQDYSDVREYGQDEVDRVSKALKTTGAEFQSMTAKIRAEIERERAKSRVEESKDDEHERLKRLAREEAERRAMEEFKTAQTGYDSVSRTNQLLRGIERSLDESEIGGYVSSNMVR